MREGTRQELDQEKNYVQNYRVRHQVIYMVLLKVFMAVTQAGGPILQLLCSQARKNYKRNF